MKRTTIFADEMLLDEIKALASEERRSVAEIIREALVQHVQRKKQKPKQLSYVGVGASGKKNIAEQHEKLLWRKAQR
jgi:metal-responsive CopG/Arc/MetJ family transcriptional regulator